MAGPVISDRARGRRAVPRRTPPLAVGGRAQDHWQPLVGAAVLRTQGAHTGEPRWNTGKSQLRRCGIYTRKSSEEGLEQDFNSLHAQRETCEAFVKSQHGEGWRLVRTGYDNGGFSGATMERPALKRLLAESASGSSMS